MPNKKYIIITFRMRRKKAKLIVCANTYPTLNVNCNVNLNTLPAVLISRIRGLLTIVEIARARIVCHQWNNRANSETVEICSFTSPRLLFSSYNPKCIKHLLRLPPAWLVKTANWSQEMWRNLQSLRISTGPMVSSQDLSAPQWSVIIQLEKVSCLRLSGCGGLSDNMHYLCELPSLRTLTLAPNKPLTDADHFSLAKLKLHYLSISQELSLEFFAAKDGNKQHVLHGLRKLELSWRRHPSTKMTKQFLTHLSGLTQLEELRIAFDITTSFRLLAPLRGLVNLEILSLSNIRTDDRSPISLELQQLRSLDIVFWGSIRGAILVASQQKSLECLVMTSIGECDDTLSVEDWMCVPVTVTNLQVLGLALMETAEFKEAAKKRLELRFLRTK